MPDVEAAYMRISPEAGAVAFTVAASDTVNVDVAADGRVLGVERIGGPVGLPALLEALATIHVARPGSTPRTEWKVRYKAPNRDLARFQAGGVVPVFTCWTSAFQSRDDALWAAGATVDAHSTTERVDLTDRVVFRRQVVDWPDGGRYEGPWVQEESSGDD